MVRAGLRWCEAPGLIHLWGPTGHHALLRGKNGKHLAEKDDIDGLKQWFSTFSLIGAKSRLTALLESRTEVIYCKSVDTFWFIAERSCYTKYQRYYRKTAESHANGAWELHTVLKTVVENPFSQSTVNKQFAKPY